MGWRMKIDSRKLVRSTLPVRLRRSSPRGARLIEYADFFIEVDAKTER